MLGLALSFVVCEWRGCLSEENDPRGPAAATEHSGTVKNLEGHRHHDNEDHGKEEDHDHHGNSGHHEHQHPNSLYHHGVVLRLR